MSPRRNNQRTVYLADEALKCLADAESLSGRLSGIVLRYHRIVCDQMPQLTRAQWCAIADANNGCCVDDVIGADAMSTWLWANVADSTGLAEKWEVDVDDLIDTMRQWSLPQSVAAWEAVRRFWQHTDIDTDQAMRLAGMVVA